MRILVVGAGVSGLTTGVRLAEAGHEVVIWTRDLPDRPTSAVASTMAAAVWEPYAVEPLDRVLLWGKVAYDEFEHLAAMQDAGVVMRDALEATRAAGGAPDWSDLVKGFHQCAAFGFRAPVIEMPVYLKYLRARFESRGTLNMREVPRLRDAFTAWDEAFPGGGDAGDEPRVVVNCTGLGALPFVDDRALYARRGQVVRVVDPDFKTVLMADERQDSPTYIIPRINDIVLGGTFQEIGPDDLLDPARRAFDPEKYAKVVAPDPGQRSAILRRCAKLALRFREDRFAMSLAALVGGDFAAWFRGRVRPEYRDTEPAVKSEDYDGCGLRPCHRRGVQLRRERLAPDRAVIHNYGHGGAGVTLSWGCADEVLALVGTL